jgi:aminopeptidase
MAYQPALEKITGFDINWNIVAYPELAWAKQVFPNETDDVAVAKLADAIFAASRVDVDDPIGAWKAHNAALKTRTEWLNGHNFHALHFTGPGTDLTVGLADGHEWMGGASAAKNGITCNPNIPTEEVFTTPDPERTEGHVTSSKPLVLADGTVVRNLRVRFEGGRAVQIDADTAQDTMRTIAEHDSGAARLGEVALVDAEGRIGKLDTVFYDTLIDENAASHIALGQGFPFLISGEDRDRSNESEIHIDFMIGTPEMTVTGITVEGDRVPVLVQGQWQI